MPNSPSTFLPRARLFGLLAMMTIASVSIAPSKPNPPLLPPDAPQRAPFKPFPPLPPADEIAKLPPDGGPKYNRLIFEKSPYLLQHSANPVDWYTWGPEAFAKAKAEDKLIFLSIGYTTSHWCRVMAHESFEDSGIAALLNSDYVAIKVDREERPDVDATYETVLQQLTGQTGWPVTVVLTPERKPVFAGMYFPRTSMPGRAGLVELLPNLSKQWKENRKTLEKMSEDLAPRLIKSAQGSPGAMLTDAALAGARKQLGNYFDGVDGGFGFGPKYPATHHLRFLLMQSLSEPDDSVIHFIELTLKTMRRGGIFDQVGFGFHRYSTDKRWQVPRFEKLLTDQAQIALTYTEAWQITKEPDLRQAAQETIEYMLRDLHSPEGAFYCAQDSDSEGNDGAFYTWTFDELRPVLGEEDLKYAADLFDLSDEGNYIDPITHLHTGRNILRLKPAPSPLSGASPEVTLRVREKLMAARALRTKPVTDDKILTSWNGLAISALAKGSSAFDEPRYAEAARRAADFILDHLHDSSGRLMRRYKDGDVGLSASLDDYSIFANSLIDLYEATFDERYLREAIRLSEEMHAHFTDAERGGYFLSPDDLDTPLVRMKTIDDGPLPSGNAMAAQLFARLAHVTGNMDLETRSWSVMSAFAGAVATQSGPHSELLMALAMMLGSPTEIVISGDPQAADTRAIIATVRSRYHPNTVVLLRPPGDSPEISKLSPFTRELIPVDGKATTYVCQNFKCEHPITDLEELGKLLETNVR